MEAGRLGNGVVSGVRFRVSANWRRETEEREVERKRAEASKLKAEGSKLKAIQFIANFRIRSAQPATSSAESRPTPLL